MPTLRGVVAATGGTVLLLAAVVALAVGRAPLRSAFPVLDGVVLHVAVLGAVSAGSWLLVHAWNTRRHAGRPDGIRVPDDQTQAPATPTTIKETHPAIKDS
ncbi:hypothetical protein [Kineococcus sp. SYSU DK001]|uniref:hypothetical protein n=1 Tax=Kineococcus sp. SYSU DK001 TaxID=3383122 RepID=UPI003D7DC75C